METKKIQVKCEPNGVKMRNGESGPWEAPENFQSDVCPGDIIEWELLGEYEDRRRFLGVQPKPILDNYPQQTINNEMWTVGVNKKSSNGEIGSYIISYNVKSDSGAPDQMILIDPTLKVTPIP